MIARVRSAECCVLFCNGQPYSWEGYDLSLVADAVWEGEL